MPRATKKDKFFIYTAEKSGNFKNKMLLGVNHFYEGDVENINLQDLLDFIKEKNIDPSRVHISSSFSSYAKA